MRQIVKKIMAAILLLMTIAPFFIWIIEGMTLQGRNSLPKDEVKEIISSFIKEPQSDILTKFYRRTGQSETPYLEYMESGVLDDGKSVCMYLSFGKACVIVHYTEDNKAYIETIMDYTMFSKELTIEEVINRIEEHLNPNMTYGLDGTTLHFYIKGAAPQKGKLLSDYILPQLDFSENQILNIEEAVDENISYTAVSTAIPVVDEIQTGIFFINNETKEVEKLALIGDHDTYMIVYPGQFNDPGVFEYADFLTDADEQAVSDMLTKSIISVLTQKQCLIEGAPYE